MTRDRHAAAERRAPNELEFGTSSDRAASVKTGERPLQVLFLTGQSAPPCCALSPVQRAFLEALPLPASTQPALNFPYATDARPWRPTPLVVSSVRQVRQYAAARRPAFAARHGASVARQLAQAERTLILAGSNGLELFANLRLPRATLERVHVFAYGPVARRRPDCDCVLVQGRRDWLSRIYFGKADVDHRVDCAHLDYLRCPEVLTLCVGLVQRLSSRASLSNFSNLRDAGGTGETDDRGEDAVVIPTLPHDPSSSGPFMSATRHRR